MTLFAGLAASAATAVEPPAASVPANAGVAAASAEVTSTVAGEPNVRRTVIQDQNARIDELRVRGQTQRVVVTPKAPGSKPYEIIMGNAGQAVPDGTGGANSAAGKRVWSVLSF